MNDIEFLPPLEFCRTCRDEVVMQIFKGTGVCCELCRKVDVGEISAEEWIDRMEVRDEQEASTR